MASCFSAAARSAPFSPATAGSSLSTAAAAGFVVAARSSHELSPGGDHLMLMKPGAAIAAGDQVPFTLTLAGGATVPFTAIAKPFAGAEESYQPEMPMGSAGPMGGAGPVESPMPMGSPAS